VIDDHLSMCRRRSYRVSVDNRPVIYQTSADAPSMLGQALFRVLLLLVRKTDEMTESRNSRRFCSTFFLTIFLKCGPLPVRYLPIVGHCQTDIYRLSADIREASVDYTSLIHMFASFGPRLSIGRCFMGHQPSVQLAKSLHCSEAGLYQASADSWTISMS
jgi:hypothetical protein